MSVTAAELSQIQQDLAQNVCDQSCDLYPPVSTPDAYGSPAYTWPTKSATVKCGASEPSANELTNFAYAIADKATLKLHFPIGTVVDKHYHCVIAGQTLEVHVLLTPRSYPGFIDVIAAEVK